MTGDHAPDPVVEANRQLLLDRSRVGVAKYGVTLGASGLTHRQLLQHALEEALDFANYIQAVIRRLDAVGDRLNTTMRRDSGQIEVCLSCGDEQLERVVASGLSDEQARAVMDIAHLSTIGSIPPSEQGSELAYYRRMKARR